MGNLTAAQAARTTAALEKSVWLNGRAVTFNELLDGGAVAYVRTRIASDGKRSYGIILHEDAINAHYIDTPTLASALARTPFYDAPKMVTDAIQAEGISRLTINIADQTYKIGA